MVQTYEYRSPATPGNPAWVVDLGNQAVRLGSIDGLQTQAELGSPGISSIRMDDPTGTAGHDGDAIVGLKQFTWFESLAPSDKNVIWQGYIGDRRYRRGTEGQSPSLITEAGRVIDITLVDLNTFLSFRLLGVDDTSAFNRVSETDVERVAALLAVDYLSTTLFDNGLVESSGGVTMDAVDYTGQRPIDVLNDCAQQSGRNFFVYYDETAGQFSLFYHKNDDLVYASDMQVSNVLADIDDSTTFYPYPDAELVRDPSRVISGVFFQNGSNSVYVTRPTTSYTYGWRDAIGDSVNLKTKAQEIVRGNRYLDENSTEDDRITWTCKQPAAHVNDCYAGQYLKVKFTHLPGYEGFTNVRVLSRTVMQNVEDDTHYDIKYEATPMAPAISGAYDYQEPGDSGSGIPVLPKPTTPGNLLIAVLAGAGSAASVYPQDLRFYDDPDPGSPPTPPYSSGDSAAWTVIDTSTTDYGGMNTGGPCGGYTPGGGTCVSGLIVGIAYRFVQPSEVTTTPVAVSTEFADGRMGVWLWEVPITTAPSGTSVNEDAHVPGSVTFGSALPAITGNALAVVLYATSAGHGAVLQPTTESVGVGSLVNGQLVENNQAIGQFGANADLYCQIVQMTSGGTLANTISIYSGYTSLNYCAVAVSLPSGVKLLPTIPYPANQVGS